MKKTVLDIQDASLHFEKKILAQLNYEVHEGDFIVILGSNGSGKSSLLKLIDRRYSLSSGRIILEKKLLADYPAKQFSRYVKTLSQNCNESLFMSLTVMENYVLISQQREKQNREFFADYIAKFNANLPNKVDQVVDQLSGGEKQALALALTLLYPPRILLLDEHTSALDPRAAYCLMELTQEMVTKSNITCLMTTHDLEIAKHYGNRILALKNGCILQCIENDEKSELTQNNLLAACY